MKRRVLAGSCMVLALLTLAVSCRSVEGPDDLAFVIDPAISPVHVELPGFDDAPPRPVAALVDDEGTQIDFIANELILATDDADVVTDFLARWSGEVLVTVDPAASGIPAPALHLVRVSTSGTDTSRLPADLRTLEPGGAGTFRVSGEAGLEVLAAAASEAANEGLSVTVNWVLSREAITRGSTVEAPLAVGNRSGDFGRDAFAWPYMKRAGVQNIGVTDAWRVLVAAGVLAPDFLGILQTSDPITIMVLDGGFQFNTDFPGYGSVVSNSEPNPWGCGGSECPWHGTEVVMAGMGRPDNAFGAAGPGGPVARVVTVPSPNSAFSSVPDFFAFLVYPIRVMLDVVTTSPDIINISAGAPVPFPLNKLVNRVADPLFAGLRTAGILVFASAGNDGKDVNRTRGSGPFRHQKYTYVPCENDFVICVGGLGWDSRQKAGNSSYGSRGGVDIFGPFEVWVGPNPDDREGGGLRNIARLKAGTSFSSPFVAGVAALVWTANPGLSASQVERILMDTAHRNTPDDRVPRWVNALGAVQRALGDVPPYVEISAPSTNPAELHLNLAAIFRAQTFDPDDGSPCCTVTWATDQDGTLGVGTGPEHVLAHTFGSVGTRVVTATAQNGAGTVSSASVTVDVVNTPPVLAVVSPTSGAQAFAGQPVVLRATSFDPNEPPDSALPCSSLVWTSSVGSDPLPLQGCELEVSFATAGSRTLTVTGTDSQGATGSAAVQLVVLEPPANLPPVVRITSPTGDSDFNIQATMTLSGTVEDPEGDAIVVLAWTVTWTHAGQQNGPELIGTTASLQWVPSSVLGGGEGQYAVTLRFSATDEHGNAGSDSMEFEFIVIN